MKCKRSCLLLLLLSLLFCTACNQDTTSQSPEEKQKDLWASAIASAVEEGGMKKIGEPVTLTTFDGTEREYTVLDAKVYDHYSDAGISESDCAFGLTDREFILVDIKIKKLKGEERKGPDDFDILGELNLYNQQMLKEKSKGNSVSQSEMCYFSGYINKGKRSGEDDKQYNYYWLDPGEEAVFQVGWCVHDPWTGREKTTIMENTEGLVLNVSAGSNTTAGSFIDLTR